MSSSPTQLLNLTKAEVPTVTTTLTGPPPSRPHVVWVGWDHPAFGALVELEDVVFPETSDLFAAHRRRFCFLTLLVDNKIRYLIRLSVPALFNETNSLPYLLDELVASDQGLSLDELYSYYDSLGVDLHRTLSVETAFRVGPQLPAVQVAAEAYLALFTLANEVDGDAIFSYLNKPGTQSIVGAGITLEPIAGRADLQTPNIPGVPGFDAEYTPVCARRTPANTEIYDILAPFTAQTDWADKDFVVTIPPWRQ